MSGKTLKLIIGVVVAVVVFLVALSIVRSLTKKEMKARFQKHFKEAERLIKETGYHRRDKELEELRKEL